MSKTTGVILFVLGAAIGSAVTWQIVSRKFEGIIEKEVESVRDTFKRRYSQADKPQHSEDVTEESPVEEPAYEATDYTSYSKKKYDHVLNSYRGDEEETDEEEEEYTKVIIGERPVMNGPYVITPEEFGEYDDYDRVDLTYYADGFLADEYDDLVSNVDENVGYICIDHIGEYEEDVVHVRNDQLKVDYEITRDLRKFKDISSMYANYSKGMSDE